MLYSEKYKNIVIEVHFNEESKKFDATSIFGNSCNPNNRMCRGYDTPVEAVEDVKKVIDAFLVSNPKNYKELAEAITNSLIWTGYEDCYADEIVIETLVQNFLKAKQ